MTTMEQIVVGWICVAAGGGFALAQTLTVHPWQAGLALGILLAVCGGVLIVDGRTAEEG